MATKPGRPFSDIASLVETLDLIVFRGGEFVSNIISVVESASVHNRLGGAYTHVGVAVRARDLLGHTCQRPDRLLVVESTMSGSLADGVPDIEGHAHLGVQVRELEAVVKAYDVDPATHMAWLPLQQKLRDSICLSEFAAVYGRYRGVFYDASALDLAAAAVPLLRPARDAPGLSCLRGGIDFLCCCCCQLANCDKTDKKLSLGSSQWQFCSELAANMYKDLGLLPPDVNPRDVLPCDFLPAGADTSASATTLDADKKVPWMFTGVVQFHSDAI
jgi:hypothetical protein